MTTTRFAWDLAAATPVVLSDGRFADYIYGHELLGKADAMGVTYAHADVLGSVRLLTDGGGNAVGSAPYDAFGAVRSQSGTQLAFGFAGEQRDAESGLVYLRARYYDPQTGRFLTKDPVRGSVRRPARQHAYVYGLNNPLRYRDPSGREAEPAGGTTAPSPESVDDEGSNGQTERVIIRPRNWERDACYDCSTTDTRVSSYAQSWVTIPLPNYGPNTGFEIYLFGLIPGGITLHIYAEGTTLGGARVTQDAPYECTGGAGTCGGVVIIESVLGVTWHNLRTDPITAASIRTIEPFVPFTPLEP